MEDFSRFVDFPTSPSFLSRFRYDAGPFPLVYPSALDSAQKGAITVCGMVRKPDWTREGFQRYYLENHGPLGETTLPTFGIVKYLRFQNVGPTGGEHLWGTSAPDFADLALFFNDPEAAARNGKQEGFRDRARAFGAALQEDEKKFMDLPQWHVMVATPRYTFSPASSSPPAKL